jgi:hypothetical protein
MIKLITPLGMLFTVALMAVFTVYALWTAHIDKSWLYLGLGIVSIAACIGVALLRTWSQYLVYFLTTAFIAGWLHSVYTGATAGYFEFFFSSRLLAAKTLVPGLILVLLSGAANWIAFSHFRRAPQTS